MSKKETGYDLESPASRTARDAPSRSAESGAESTTFGLTEDERKERIRDRERWADDETRRAYRTPVIMFIVGAGVTSIVFAATDGPLIMLQHLLSYAISVPIGVLVYLLCCKIWIGFDAPIHLIALRLVGIYAVTDLVFVLVLFIPILPLILWIVPAAVYVALLAEMFDIELVEAVVVGLVTFIAKTAVAIAIL